MLPHETMNCHNLAEYRTVNDNDGNKQAMLQVRQ